MMCALMKGVQMPNAVETLSAAKQAGLRLALDGADLIVAGFKRLAPAAAAHWRWSTRSVERITQAR